MKQVATRSGHQNGIEKKVREKGVPADAGSVIWCRKHQLQMASMGKKGPGMFQDVEPYISVVLKPVLMMKLFHAAVPLS